LIDEKYTTPDDGYQIYELRTFRDVSVATCCPDNSGTYSTSELPRIATDRLQKSITISFVPLNTSPSNSGISKSVITPETLQGEIYISGTFRDP
jgi:hypothetical protein